MSGSGGVDVGMHVVPSHLPPGLLMPTFTKLSGGLSYLPAREELERQSWEEEQLQPAWLRAKSGRAVALSQLSSTALLEGAGLVGMPDKWREVRRRQKGWGDGDFLEGSELEKTLLVLHNHGPGLGRGWAVEGAKSPASQTGFVLQLWL